MQNCFNCGNALPEHGSYCPECASQVRCRSCQNGLEANWRACPMCGMRIGEGTVIQVEKDAGRARTDGLNDIKFEETTKSRSASATLTDEGLAHLSDALVAFVTGGQGIRTARISKAATRIVTPTNDRQLLLLDKGTEPIDTKDSSDQQVEFDSDKESIDRGDEQSSEDSKAEETDREKLHRLFRYEGERIHPNPAPLC